MDRIRSSVNTASDFVNNTSRKVFDTTSEFVNNTSRKVFDTTSNLVHTASDTFDSTVNKTSDLILNHEIHGFNISQVLIPIIGIFLILYVPYVRPSLPKSVEKLFENPVFRFVMYAYIVYRATHDPTSALVISAAYIVVIMIINRQKIDAVADKTKKQNNY